MSSSIYRALGFHFEVQFHGMDSHFLREAVDWAFEGLRAEPGCEPDHAYRFSVSGPHTIRLERENETLGDDVSEWIGLSTMMTDLNREASASRPDRLTVHAGTLSSGGTGILLPADSGSGKTTLTAALVRAGCDYLTDEVAAIDLSTLLVEPYAKPLSLSPSSIKALGCPPSEHGPMELIPASWLRANPWSGPVRTGLIVFPGFQPHAPAQLTPVSRGEALVELANNSFNFVDHGGEWLPGLRDIVAGCECWRITFGNALEAAELIMGLTG